MPRPPLEWAFLDGEFVAARDARVSAYDRGFLFGDGVYEVIPVYGGRPFHADLHLARLANSLLGIELETPWNDAWWRAAFDELIERNGGGDQSLYLQVTRGAELGRDHRFPDGVEPTVFMFCTATPPRDATVDRDGLAAVSAHDYRWERCDLKTTALLANVLLRQHAQKQGADEVILHRGGRLTEASVSNVFAVTAGRAATPPLGCELLPGVTRIVVSQLCGELGIGLDEAPLTLDALRAADEIWICSSSREIAPVVKLDGRAVGGGKPGPVYAKIRAAFDALIAQWRGETRCRCPRDTEDSGP
jgi:D-alanine transaminase